MKMLAGQTQPAKFKLHYLIDSKKDVNGKT